ncbi:hypothetical protein [Caldivirga sp. MU80]|uniref:hypothetical protein n=1 Tax=Caldivirga sp. MU80 TaxID=1650354 RepID=UPI0008307921|nr:hypothetical protein [Caldivirga sp. MU80]
MATNPFKITLLISILSIAIALTLIWGTAQTAPNLIRYSTLSNDPYIKVESINVTANGVYIRLAIINNGALAFTPTGGWVEVVETGQVVNVTIINGTVIAKLPLTPQWMGLASVGVKGIVSGTLNGSRAYIAFFDVAPIHIINTIGITNVSYADCVLNVTLSVNTVVPVVIRPIINMSLFTVSTPGYYVFETIGIVNITVYAPAGSHNVTLMIRVSPVLGRYTYVYSCNYLSGFSKYTLWLPIGVTYMYPTGNITSYTLLTKTFIVGGGS